MAPPVGAALTTRGQSTRGRGAANSNNRWAGRGGAAVNHAFNNTAQNTVANPSVPRGAWRGRGNRAANQSVGTRGRGARSQSPRSQNQWTFSSASQSGQAWRDSRTTAPDEYRNGIDSYFTELRASRDRERVAAIKQGFIADPDKPRTLDQAIKLVGTCQDMCPEFERIERIAQSMVDKCERIPGNYGKDVPWEEYMVKRFRRAAAGNEEQLPSDIRPPIVLQKTLNYLLDDVIGSGDTLLNVHKFVWDRTRAIRNDFSIQQVTKIEDLVIAIDCFERIARFHILSLHQLSNPVLMRNTDFDFDHHQEREQLNNTLLSLMYYYDDSRNKLVAPNEAEFRAYTIIFEIQDMRPDTEDRVQSLPPRLLKHPRVQNALSIYAAAGNTINEQGPLIPRAPFPVARQNYAGFFSAVASPATSYVMACTSEIFFNQIRVMALETIRAAYKRPVAGNQGNDLFLQDLTDMLGCDDEDECQLFCEEHGFRWITRDDGELVLDLLSVPAGKLTDGRERRKQTFSVDIVEVKRMSRPLASVINGLTVAQCRAMNLLESADEEMSENADDGGLFLEDYKDEEEKTGEHEIRTRSKDEPSVFAPSHQSANPFEQMQKKSEDKSILNPFAPKPDTVKWNPFAPSDHASKLTSPGSISPTSEVKPLPAESALGQSNQAKNPFFSQAFPKPTFSAGKTAEPVSPLSTSQTGLGEVSKQEDTRTTDDSKNFFKLPPASVGKDAVEPIQLGAGSLKAPPTPAIEKSVSDLSKSNPLSNLRRSSSPLSFTPSKPSPLREEVKPDELFSGAIKATESVATPSITAGSMSRGSPIQSNTPQESIESIAATPHSQPRISQFQPPRQPATPSQLPVKQDSSPRSKITKDAFLHNLATGLCTDRQGFISQFLQNEIIKIVEEETRHQELERENILIRNFQKQHTLRRYIRQWSKDAWSSLLKRKARDRRERMKMYADGLGQSLTTSRASSVVESPKSSALLEEGKHVDNPKRRSLPGQVKGILEDKSEVAQVSSLPGPRHKRSKTSAVNLVAKTQNEMPPPRIPTMEELMVQARRMGPVGKTDTTHSDYFLLKAHRLDPETPTIPQTKKRRLSPQSTADFSDSRFDLGQSHLPFARSMNDSQELVQGSPTKELTHLSSSLPSTIPHLRAHANGTTPTFNTSTLSQPASKYDDDTQLFTQIAALKSAMSDSISWFKSVRESEERSSPSIAGSPGTLESDVSTKQPEMSRSMQRLLKTGASGFWKPPQKMDPTQRPTVLGPNNTNNRIEKHSTKPNGVQKNIPTAMPSHQQQTIPTKATKPAPVQSDVIELD